MADASRQLDIIISAKDEASKRIKGIGDSFKSLTDDAKLGATLITGAMALVAKSAIKIGTDFEQARISFETMLGSGEKAGKLLKDISDFAAKTPFDLPQVIDGTKRLIAYGFAEDTVLKTTKMLGDVSSGLAIPLGDLVYLFGTLKAQGRAFSKDIYQFTNRGIPIVAELAKQFNTTEAAIYEMVTEGSIGFPEIEKAFQAMTGEGGKFFNLMDKQSRSLGGIISNIRDEFVRFSLAIIGFTEGGEVRQGSIFYYLKMGADKFREALTTLRPMISGFVDGFLKNLPAMSTAIGVLIGLMIPLVAAFVAMIAPALEMVLIFGAIGLAVGKLIENYIGKVGLEVAINNVKGAMQTMHDFIQDKLIIVTDWLSERVKYLSDKVGGKEGLKEKWDQFKETAKAVWDFAMRFIIPMWEFMTARIASLIERIKQMNIDWEAVGSMLKFLAIVVGAVILAFLLGLMTIISAIAWTIEHIVVPVVQMWIDIFTSVINTIKSLIGWLKDAYDWIKKVFSDKKASFSVSTKNSKQHGGFINAPYGQAVPAMLHGGERVVPRTGVDVNSGGSGIGTLNLNFSGPVSMDSEARVNDLAKKIISILGRQSELAGKGLAI